MRISLSTEAKTDGRDAVEWYIDEGAFSAVNAFADELEHTLHLLRQFSEMGIPTTHGARVLPLRTFPYSLVYRIHIPWIRVIAIANHRRRSGYWVGQT